MAILADNPWGYWRLDEPSGSVAYDCSGYGRDATFQGGVTLAAGGRGPGSLAASAAPVFDGSSGHVVLPTIPSTTSGGPFGTAYTFELWCHFGSFPSQWARFFDIGNNYGINHSDDIILTFNNWPGVTLGFRVLGGFGDNTPAAGVADSLAGVWFHLVLTLQLLSAQSGAYSETLYLNGAAAQTWTGTASPWISDTARSVGYLARSRWTTDPYFFGGSLAEFAIYGYALTAAQVAAHYAAAQPSPPPPPPPSPPINANDLAAMHALSAAWCAFKAFWVFGVGQSDGRTTPYVTFRCCACPLVHSYSAMRIRLDSALIANLFLSFSLRRYPGNAGSLPTWASVDPCSWAGVACLNGAIVYMDVSTLWMTGTLPGEIGLLSSVTTLWLHNNYFSSTIPSQLGRLSSSLFQINIGGNLLTGTLPTQLAQLTLLNYFHFNDNSLSGILPSFLGALTNLVDLGFQNNDQRGRFTGSLPSQLMQLTSLHYLSTYGVRIF